MLDARCLSRITFEDFWCDFLRPYAFAVMDNLSSIAFKN